VGPPIFEKQLSGELFKSCRRLSDSVVLVSYIAIGVSELHQALKFTTSVSKKNPWDSCWRSPIRCHWLARQRVPVRVHCDCNERSFDMKLFVKIDFPAGSVGESTGSIN
jgi:hypothetical protein